MLSVNFAFNSLNGCTDFIGSAFVEVLNVVLRFELQSWEENVVVAHHGYELVDSLSNVSNIAIDRTTVCSIANDWFAKLAGKVHFDKDACIKKLIKVCDADITLIEELADINQVNNPRKGKRLFFLRFECSFEPPLKDIVEFKSVSLWYLAVIAISLKFVC